MSLNFTVEKSHPSFPQPEDDEGVVWRYMSTLKLLSMLMDSKLHFTRLDQLSDAFEGKMPPRFRNSMLRYWKKEFESKKISNIDAEKVVGHQKINLKTIFVNSWCYKEKEDVALWSLYGDQGFAVQSTYGKLCSALVEERQFGGAVFAGRVTYIDFESVDQIDIFKKFPFPWNDLTLVSLKDYHYDSEREVRLVAWNLPENPENPHLITDSLLGKHETSFDVSVDLSKLISKIVAGPSTPDWGMVAVKKLCNSIGLDIEVSKSSVAVRNGCSPGE